MKTKKTIKKNSKSIPVYKSKKNSYKLDKTLIFINYVKTIFEDESFDDSLLEKVNYFAKDKIGKSGAQIGFINYKNSTRIIKIFKNQKKSLFIKINKDCIYLNYDFNELFISYLLNNIHLVLKGKPLEEFKRKNYQKFLIKNYICKINKKNLFIINELVGIKYKTKYYTNLKEIMVFNYIPYIISLLNKKENDQKYNQKNKKELDNFLNHFCKLINDWFEVQLFLNKNLGMIHTDCHFANVFIKICGQTNQIKNIRLLFSDLDKLDIN